MKKQSFHTTQKHDQVGKKTFNVIIVKYLIKKYLSLYWHVAQLFLDLLF